MKNTPVISVGSIVGIVAVALLLVALLVGGYFLYESAKNTVGRQKITTCRVSVTPDGEHQIVLADSTEVTLSKNSEFIYGNGRECELQGEACFKVPKGDGPFVVHTGHLKVTVPDAEFKIGAYGNDGLSTVTLYSGQAKIDYETGAHTLEPGTEFTYNSVNRLMSVNTVGNAGTSMTDDTSRVYSLGEVFRSIEQKYSMSVIGEHLADTAQRFTFRLLDDDRVGDILSALKAAGGNFDYRIDNDTIIIEAIK